MAGIGIEKRLKIDNKKLEAKTAKREELLIELKGIEAEIKILKDRIEFNTKKYNDKRSLFPSVEGENKG